MASGVVSADLKLLRECLRARYWRSRQVVLVLVLVLVLGAGPVLGLYVLVTRVVSQLSQQFQQFI